MLYSMVVMISRLMLVIVVIVCFCSFCRLLFKVIRFCECIDSLCLFLICCFS